MNAAQAGTIELKKGDVESSPIRYARLAGFLYLIIAILGIFVNFFVFESLIVAGDVSATANNILANESLFRTGTSLWFLVLIIDVVIAWALYIVLKAASPTLSLLTAWFRLVYIGIFAVTQLMAFIALQLLGDTEALSAIGTTQLQSLAYVFLNAFRYGFLISLVFFGVHLALLGFLIMRSRYLPSILGGFLIGAAVGYLVDSFAHFLLPNYADYEMIFMLIVAVPALVAEVGLTFWLLVKGIDVQAWKKQAQANLAPAYE